MGEELKRMELVMEPRTQKDRAGDLGSTTGMELVME